MQIIAPTAAVVLGSEIFDSKSRNGYQGPTRNSCSGAIRCGGSVQVSARRPNAAGMRDGRPDRMTQIGPRTGAPARRSACSTSISTLRAVRSISLRSIREAHLAQREAARAGLARLGVDRVDQRLVQLGAEHEDSKGQRLAPVVARQRIPALVGLDHPQRDRRPDMGRELLPAQLLLDRHVAAVAAEQPVHDELGAARPGPSPSARGRSAPARARARPGARRRRRRR